MHKSNYIDFKEVENIYLLMLLKILFNISRLYILHIFNRYQNIARIKEYWRISELSNIVRQNLIFFFVALAWIIISDVFLLVEYIDAHWDPSTPRSAKFGSARYTPIFLAFDNFRLRRARARQRDTSVLLAGRLFLAIISLSRSRLMWPKVAEHKDVYRCRAEPNFVERGVLGLGLSNVYH